MDICIENCITDGAKVTIGNAVSEKDFERIKIYIGYILKTDHKWSGVSIIIERGEFTQIEDSARNYRAHELMAHIVFNILRNGH